ncbi:peptidase S8 and S53 subtilisin kexin sedolisin [Fervidobacterium nodosum Rt17-B1]|uniref:Peptidase S8 and S53 subtilisin kexin sedolisin n=2 Tax=Fervidobacterium nodosum TaxID=2424 RepID=A7HLX7_FERNB|nr:peptidase S8 and S53 subtilisin kexin sedolisin [Fervidobacterium nodosum Rt17-B1]
MMKKSLLFVSIALVFLLVFSCALNKPDSNKSLKPFEPGFDPRNVETTKPDGFKIIYGELKEGEYTEGKVLVGYTDRNAALEVAKLLNGKIIVDLPQIKMVSVKFNGTVAEAYEKIKEANIKGIKYVEPSYKRELIAPTKLTPDQNILGNKGKVSPLARDYGEELSNELWGLEAMGITSSLWNEASGTDIIVAVVDTGVDGTHPDLEGQVIEGYRPFIGKVLPAGTDSSYGGAHGTHVAGTIAAKKDGKGIVGVAPNAKIMPIVIFDDPALVGGNGYVGDDYVAAGIIWAVEHGAKVMNHSWGGWGYSHTMKAAFDYALKNNVVMVVSAGNDHTDQHHHYPSGYPGVIQVAAAEYYGGNYRTVWFSNRSDAITVAAPGVTILSTVPGINSIGYEGHNSNVRVSNGGTYDYYQGTSMAAPHVTGAVAVLLQKFPNAKVWQIRKLLEQTAMDIDDAGFDHSSGYGLAQLDDALNGILPTDGGINELNILVTDAYGEFGVPTVMVKIVRPDGACYYAKTGLDGYARFYHIDSIDFSDPDVKLIVAGPDHWERSLAPTADGSLIGAWQVALRMEEERKGVVVDPEPLGLISEDATITAVLSSEFKIELGTKLPNDAMIIITDPMASSVYGTLPYSNNPIDLSVLSGQVTIGVIKLLPPSQDITIQGTVTLNGDEIPVSGVIRAGKTFTVVDDYGGMNFGTETEPFYAWWTVFGKK